MKKLIIIFLILIIPIGIISWKYNKYKNELSVQPPSFDLFIAKSFFKKDKDYPWKEYWDNAWNNVSMKRKRPTEWLLNKKDFEKLDSVYLGFKNISNEKIYYVTWGQPNSRIRDELLIYRNGKIDSIPFGGFGCGSGIYITPLKNGEIAGSKISNPFLYNPYTGYPLPLKNEIFPELFKEIYGDSIAIKFKQATYSLPWNKFPSQKIESKQIIISTKEIIKSWKNGNFSFKSEFETENENSYYFQENGIYKLSSLFKETE